MKYSNLLVGLALIIGFIKPLVALSEEFEPALKPEVVGDISYISGGIGESEADMMRGIAKDYPLEMVFVQKLKQQEEFLANVKVKIQDIRKNVLLDVATEGPYLFVKLPPGKYLVIAENNGDVKQQSVRVGVKKHQKIVFWWPILEQPQMEETSEE
ncbi:hypothetical protein [Methylotenera sp.]|uniref:hypothetical protein n=1 Tax=Methylotenera sp. TaxID=2051956 RepID=UPI002718D053|nr:hypothetical protein [Methylotenera sp.]MDO9206579.1 hypothetical protein [Methylotenera sp.]MDO9394091.1 hypothetical protein [Methylotenera sp.]MDP1522794.1 hypothetical protein [Methylotenera sp.]MDP2071979.1 hypothetical protein [Methylotenera sp.]MDP2231628.1 hypothetical protein [Methylotenera sp.]